MIKFNLKKNIEPYEVFHKNYKLAESASQGNIEAACLSTCSSKKIPHSRFINIKYINEAQKSSAIPTNEIPRKNKLKRNEIKKLMN